MADYSGPRKTRGSEAPNHKTASRDPYKWETGLTTGSEAPDHKTAETDPYVYEGGGSRPPTLGGDKANGTFNPPGKIGGYVDQVVGTKNPAYANRETPQDWNIGQANSTVEGGPSFAPYQDKSPASSPTDFTKSNSEDF